jgi:hypothetical protein
MMRERTRGEVLWGRVFAKESSADFFCVMENRANMICVER